MKNQLRQKFRLIAGVKIFTIGKIAVGIMCFALLCLSCGDDHGIAPLPGKLELDVMFFNPEIPENTEGVYLFVAPKFPPHAINELYLSPNSLPLGADTIHTEMDLPYGHYEAIGLWWYNKTTESNLADVFSLKIGNNYLPYEFDITPEEPVHTTDMWADLNRVERNTYIEGTIYFNGPIPGNTLATAIGAYVKKPEMKIDYLIYLKSMDFSIDENPYHFKLPVDGKGTVRYLAVFWLSDRSGLDDFKTLGFYEDPNNPGTPVELKPKPDKPISGIEIHADWSHINE
ncbi:hypothetical protein JXQ31_19075 [candidate division KSB1 bacterium]|nr:hypothetical protein [candidate division KSB1 bacterium]